MDIMHWFKPFEAFASHGHFQRLRQDALLCHTLFGTALLDEAGRQKVVLFESGPTPLYEKVREWLYVLGGTHFPTLQLYDWGCLRKAETLPDALADCLEQGFFPIVLGQRLADYALGIKAMMARLDQVSLAWVGRRLPLSLDAHFPELLDDAFASGPEGIFNLNAIGIQRHHGDPAVFAWLERRHFEVLRLGQLREQASQAEALLRDADLCCFDLDAIRRSDAAAQHLAASSGLSSEEASLLCRYAGGSDKLQGLLIGGYVPDKDPAGDTAATIAEMLWYLLDGLDRRKDDFPTSTSALTEYIVALKSSDYPLTFWKSEKSGRWWLQVPAHVGKTPARHRLIPCTFQDFVKAQHDEVPERLIRAFERYR